MTLYTGYIPRASQKTNGHFYPDTLDTVRTKMFFLYYFNFCSLYLDPYMWYPFLFVIFRLSLPTGIHCLFST